MRVPSVIVSLALILGAPVAAQTLPDTTYYCGVSSGGMIAHMGDIEIADGHYRGPAYDGAYGDWYRMKVTRAGTIVWGGPLGGFESEGSSVVSTQLKMDGTRPAFDILLQLASGNFLSISCVPT
jgi:hypothetical protein